ncbi:MAG: hypothetical protein IKS35_07435 [Clostridia bacterium]|nr:hypothetical protein [Clostridia bacterium]
MNTSKIISLILVVVMVASLGIIAVSANNMGQPSVTAPEALEQEGPGVVANPDGSPAASVTVIAVADNDVNLTEALEQVEDAGSLYNLVPMTTLKEAMNITVEGDLSEEGLAMFAAFGLEADGATPGDDGKVAVTLEGLQPNSFRHFAFIYLPTTSVTAAAKSDFELLAGSEWKVLPKEDVQVNDDGTVTLRITSYGSYMMITSNNSDLVNPFTADSMWWLFIVAGVVVAVVATVVVLTASKRRA